MLVFQGPSGKIRTLKQYWDDLAALLGKQDNKNRSTQNRKPVFLYYCKVPRGFEFEKGNWVISANYTNV